MQVRRLQAIAVDEAQSADAGAGKITDDRHAQATAADDEYATRAKFRLACRADFLERHLARVVGDRGAYVSVG